MNKVDESVGKTENSLESTRELLEDIVDKSFEVSFRFLKRGDIKRFNKINGNILKLVKIVGRKM